MFQAPQGPARSSRHNVTKKVVQFAEQLAVVGLPVASLNPIAPLLKSYL